MTRAKRELMPSMAFFEDFAAATFEEDISQGCK